MLSVLALKHSHRFAKHFDFLFGSSFFALDLFERFERLLDVVEGSLQFTADMFDLPDGVGNRGGAFGTLVRMLVARAAIMATVIGAAGALFARWLAITIAISITASATTAATKAATTSTPAARTAVIALPWRSGWLFRRRRFFLTVSL